MLDTSLISIIGASSFAKEVASHIQFDFPHTDFSFYVDDQYVTENKIFKKYNILPISLINSFDSLVLIAVGDSKNRYLLFKRLSKEINYFTFIHSSAKILNKETVKIGIGSIICASTIITCDVIIGKHTQLNLNTTIGHDTIIGDFFTTAPGVNISGNVNIGNRVYVGTNASIKEKINICDDVIIGMGASVVKDITIPGTYVGTPAKKIGD